MLSGRHSRRGGRRYCKKGNRNGCSQITGIALNTIWEIWSKTLKSSRYSQSEMVHRRLSSLFYLWVFGPLGRDGTLDRTMSDSNTKKFKRSLDAHLFENIRQIDKGLHTDKVVLKLFCQFLRRWTAVLGGWRRCRRGGCCLDGCLSEGNAVWHNES